MWTDITRTQYARKHCRLPSGLTDAEWALIGPLLMISGSVGFLNAALTILLCVLMQIAVSSFETSKPTKSCS